MRILPAGRPKSSAFASILETLEQNPEGDGDMPLPQGPGGHVRPDDGQGKEWLLQLIGSLSESTDVPHAEDRATARYVAEAAETVPLPKPAAPPPPRPDDPASVAAELALRADMGEEELRHIRRAFALANHPDRFLPEERARATRRMTIANTLIDQHLRRKGTH
jgi:hypothetical protein